MKGDKQRPLQISLKEFNRRWEKAFGKDDAKKKQVPTK